MIDIKVPITVIYSCKLCGIHKAEVTVAAREPGEDLMRWMDKMGRELSRDHDRRSPGCRPKTLSDVMIPTNGAREIGGPAAQ